MTVHLLEPNGSTLCGYVAKGWPVSRPNDWTTEAERATCAACLAAHAERVTTRADEASIPNVSPRGDTEEEGIMVALTVATKQLDALSDAADRAVKELQYPKDFCPFGLVGRLLLHLAVLHGLQRAAARSGEFDKHTALEDCGCNVAVDYRELKKREGLG